MIKAHITDVEVKQVTNRFEDTLGNSRYAPGKSICIVQVVVSDPDSVKMLADSLCRNEMNNITISFDKPSPLITPVSVQPSIASDKPSGKHAGTW